MTQNYIVISHSEDGDVHIEPMTKESLEVRLAEGDYGTDVKFLTPRARGAFDVREGPAGIFIIKGEFVTPKPRQVVQTWDV